MDWKQDISKQIFEQKYMLHDEKNVDEVFQLIAKEIASVENKKIKDDIENNFYKEISSGRFIPAGRILANARPDSKMKNYNNCFTIDIEDSMEGIYEALKQDAKISKMGGGVGFNISNLRPKNAPLSKGGVASGPISFLKVFDQSAKVVQTGGGRRSAHIAILNCDHPDIEEFITVKNGDDNKELTQFNLSVGVNDKFINAVNNNDDWNLHFDGVVYKKIKAKELYNKIVKNAYIYNEPGILNLSAINKYNNGYYLYDIEVVNPCLTGDTIIAVADGRNGVSIKDLCDTTFPVYSAKLKKYKRNKESVFKTEIKQATAFKTGKKEIIEVLLSDGSTFKCTPDHLLATKNGKWIEAQYSENCQLENFYTYINCNSEKKYRTINSYTNGYARQYRMIWEFYNGKYDGNLYNIHHKNSISYDDCINNLELVLKEDHDVKTSINRQGTKNPIFKMDYEYRCWINKKRNINANAIRWGWSDNRRKEAMDKFLKENPKPIIENNNVYMNQPIYVEEIIWTGEIEDVFDLNVEDNHNFYIITQTNDDDYQNCSGVLVHNCGEISMPEWGVCDLGAINLTKFVVKPFTKEAHINYIELQKTIQIGVRFLDNVLDVTEYPLEKIEERALEDRRIGLGITGLGDMFAMLTYKYGDENSKVISDKLFKFIRNEAYKYSIELAREKHAFPNFDKDFLQSNFIKNLPLEIQNDIKKNGIRNITCLTIAPTGTTSFSLGQNCSSGIEPIFALEYDRNIRTDNNETRKKRVYDYAWLQYLEYLEKNNYEFVDIPEYFKTALEIDPYDQIDIQGIAQKYIDNSISKTANIPEDYSKKDYEKLFMYAYEKELKGFTTFRLGSMQGILDLQNGKIKRPPHIQRTHAPKRPESLPCDIHEIIANKERHIILVGKLQGTLYEIFVTNDPENKIEKIGKKEGIIRKIKKGQYQLLIENGEEKLIFDNIADCFDETYASLSRFISMGLRHGVDLQFIVTQLQKDKNFIGFEKAVARILKKYIQEGEKVLSSEKCDNCGGELVYREGCISCIECGWSKCG